MMAPTSIHRVVSTFLLRPSLKVAVFHRQPTMPTFPSHWAACSGSIDNGETPFQAACRELREETNVEAIPNAQHGLFVDVETGQDRVIRVYPFVVEVEEDFQLELRGTEHDRYQWISVEELAALQPTVPKLLEAFHHATFGRHLAGLPKAVREWAADEESGASTMTRNALQLLIDHPSLKPTSLVMMRPSMVAIVQALREAQHRSPEDVLAELAAAAHTVVAKSVQALLPHLGQGRVAVFSRSATLVAILQELRRQGHALDIVCGRSTPGDEGTLMAEDLNAAWIEDDALQDRIRHGQVDVLLIGADCVLPESIVNKVGTRRLAEAAVDAPCRVVAAADRFKVWDDVFAPPLEAIFEEIPRDLLDDLVVPEADD